VNDLKTVVHDIIVNSGGSVNMIPKEDVIFHNEEHNGSNGTITIHKPVVQNANTGQTIEVEETLSLMDKEKDMIKKALRKHKGKRKYAAKELGISERTLYRKINEYNIVE
jgi:transcriptional regulator with PAS, ATPase and Fis domain